ncbi:MAG: tetratricopeptide repeat protein [Muribaculaceae bacterium]|nr:tetratricopeptide repeat protein [Muribaculaceae bacterium]
MQIKELLIYAAAAAAPLSAAGSDPVVPAAERPLWEAIQQARCLPSAQATGAGDLDGMLRKFIFDFPASPLREQALLQLADAAYDRGEYPEALLRYGRVSVEALEPGAAEDCLYRQAYCLLKTGDYGRAETIYRELLPTGRYGGEARFYLGYIAYARGDYRQAVAELSGVRRSAGSPTADAGYYLAQSLLMTGDYSAAAREARSLLGGDCPAEYRAETRRVLGEALYGMGDRREAVRELSRYAAEAETPTASALYILGVNDFQNGDYGRATERLAPATRLDSEMGQSAWCIPGRPT